jgi:hypothetical protein
MSDDNNRGLASADEETKERVAKAGGEARAQDKEGLSEAGKKGGQDPHEKRGLQAADEETREEVARKGGQA